ncbi:undecaprenyldiphospho-muramoylpentapeptide beta-N-acetylglucosaminyltransferase [Pseudoalteromonas ulvae]|uniref:UDP-N-acetylglucosamine--N-acetylmuramyl-(pentapeptide) pyrophosphoryl-undecaprenol N-acetylglucosamine transferase n=1 Tax=Pseudoalteromonas ulvae TaxID=107327 RepID=A0A244CQ13_PSEDV|nr:undecaprenyldiphospho-muramoylpentapeptide beta-N-acetylglucosaminyltransferase [Pseudoalteromonas ulvae]OUL57586.1 undecaprenyldiphospho-muramoylpentapeptide beta-N-acetylglucosaminyltransferase [Pseudoalteromonas ulvae]
MTKKLMVVAGGTGGHIFPGIAVADYLKAQGWQIVWLGTADRMEASVVPKHGFDIRFIKVKGVRGNGLKRLFTAPFMVLKAILAARKIMRQERPDVLLAMGGYVTGPAGIAAKTLGIPLIIHEQNAVAGVSNKLLAKFANRVCAAFPAAFEQGMATLVGNPVRASVSQITHHFDEQKCKVLVVGGSLGAAALNDALPTVFAKLNEIKPISVWHQTGKGHVGGVTAQYQSLALTANVSEFIDDIDQAYAWADLVICRAGALTVSEIAAAGKMAVFVPFPHAVDDHQTANAGYLVDSQAALLIQQHEMNTERLVALLQPYVENKELISEMAKKAKALAKLDATEQMAMYCEQLSK